MKIYIAGKITGNPNYRNEFSLAENVYGSHGHIILNPAALPDGLGEAADYMRICLPMLLSADCVVLLPNWKTSGGAKIERDLAVYLGLQTIYAESDTLFMSYWRKAHEP